MGQISWLTGFGATPKTATGTVALPIPTVANDGWRAEAGRRRKLQCPKLKIILGWTIGGSARVPRAGSGVAPEPLDALFGLGKGFRRDAENGNRDGRAPHYGRVARSAIRNSQFEMVRASFPVFILGWTIGGSARVSRAGLGVAPEPFVKPFSLGDGFSARRRKRQPGRSRSPLRTGRAFRNSQFAIRNGQGFFSGFQFGMDDWGIWRLNFWNGRS